jgi:hypothetical protein
LLDAALVSAEKPPLEKRGGSVNPRHDFVGWIQTVADDGDLMLVASVRQPGIPAPSVGVDCRPRRHGALHEGEKAIRRHILDAPKADPADGPTALFGGHGDNGVGFGAPTALALFRASGVGFVDFCRPRETIPTRPDHRPPQLVQPSPGRLVAAKPQCQSRETTFAAACAYPGTPCQPLAGRVPVPGMRRGREPVGDVARTVAMSRLRVGDVADAGGGCTPGKQRRYETTHPSVDNRFQKWRGKQSRPHIHTAEAGGREGDTQFAPILPWPGRKDLAPKARGVSSCVHKTPLEDAYRIDLDKRGDDHGFFARVFFANEFGAADLETRFLQANNSLT